MGFTPNIPKGYLLLINCLLPNTRGTHTKRSSTLTLILDGLISGSWSHRLGGWMDGEARSPFTLNQCRARMPGNGQHILMNPMSSFPIHLSRLAPVPSSLSSVSGPHLAHLQNGWVLGNDHYRTRFINFNLNLFHVHKRKILCEPSSRLGSSQRCASLCPC